MRRSDGRDGGAAPDDSPAAGPAGGDRVSKLMSLSPAEFATGVAALAAGTGIAAHAEVVPEPGRTDGRGLRAVRFMLAGGGTVTLSYATLPPVRLGGLLDLPQASVALTFAGVAPPQRAEFERRFWVVFQRGGG